ncbi:GtrA family protein [Henriciella sp.]|uniref:GtrA family protein n=1 Tax=Henriciella sp. TaxID=1968823 RepID=UPI00261486E5|nr:GtrA family protein [Henriciella sp.]
MNWLGMMTSAQFFRFAAVGLVTNLVGYAVYLMITFVGVAPAFAVTILFGLGTVISFVGNRRFTFRGSGNNRQAGLRYAVTYFLGYLLNLSILFVFVDHFGLPHQAVQAVAIFIVAGVMFLLSKYYVFSSSPSQGEDSP